MRALPSPPPSWRARSSAARAAFASLLITIPVATALSGCRNKPDRDKPVEKPRALSPGAERWDEAALELPEQAPLVLTARPQRLLQGANALYEWLITEPAMLGPGDEGIVRARELVNLREGIGRELGMDLLSTTDWSNFGVAIDRPCHAGLYPLAKQGVSFIDIVEGELVTRLGLEDEAGLMQALESYKGKDPKMLGLYSTLAKQGRNAAASAGGRFVFSMTDEARALDTVDRMMRGLGATRAQPPTNSGLERVYFMERPEDLPVMGVRAERGHLLVDVVYLARLDATEPEARKREAGEHLASALKRVGRGYPSAPRPLDAPALAISMDQQGLSALSRYSGYQAALSRALNSAASERDEELVAQLTDAVRSEYTWDVGAKGLSGFSYELHLGGERGESARLLGAHMSIFGAKGLELPDASGAGANLGLAQRSVGASFDPTLFTGERWKAWLGVEHPERILEAFDYDPDGISSGWTFLLALPRNVALLAANFEEMIKAEAPIDVIPLYAHRDKIERIDLVLPGATLTNFRARASVLGLIRISPSVAPIDRDVVSAALRDTLHITLEDDTLEMMLPPTEQDENGEEVSVEHDYASPLEPGKILPFSSAEGTQLGRMKYFYQRDGDSPWILFGYGLDEAQLAAEMKAMRERAPTTDGQGELARVRAEPAGLVQLSSAWAPASATNGVDMNILAQRIGPLILRVETNASQQRAVRYSLDLMAPPAID